MSSQIKRPIQNVFYTSTHNFLMNFNMFSGCCLIYDALLPLVCVHLCSPLCQVPEGGYEHCGPAGHPPIFRVSNPQPGHDGHRPGQGNSKLPGELPG